jgi:hypothetical protein
VDAFERTVNGSWGTGPLGSWSYETTAGTAFGLSVDGHRAVASAPDGVNKGNLLVGNAISGPADASATFTTSYEPPTGTPNHWQIVLRHQAMRTYYAAQLLPYGTAPAHLVIFEAKNGVFTDLGEQVLSFVVAPNQSYAIEASVSDDPSGAVDLNAKAWPLASQVPTAWQTSGVDSASDKLQSGTVGVRLSMYSGPVVSTVDDFRLTSGTTPSPSPSPTTSPSPSPSPTTSPSPSPSPSVSPSPTPPPTTTTVDSFTRTLNGSWGTGAAGTWVRETSAGSAQVLKVDGQQAVATARTGDKGNMVVGGSLGGTVDLRATFSASYQPATPNHWLLLLRHQAVRTYYAVELSPNGSAPADLDIFMAKNGVFTDLLDVTLAFPAVAGQQYVIEATVSDGTGGATISAKAWPAGTTAPSTWQATATDGAPDRLTTGNVGVRLTCYSGPVTFTVDDFTVTR